MAALLAMLPAVAAAVDRKLLGEIEFFGYNGFDPVAIRAALPFHEGDFFSLANAKSSDSLKRLVSASVKQVIGREPTGVSFVCCDAKQNWMAYIGLPGASYQAVAFHPSPTGSIRLPRAAIALHRNSETAFMRAVMKGNAAEDDSEGFALSNDREARASQLAMRDYALRNEPLIFDLLRSSSDARHRAIAALMLGYGRQSEEQVEALVHASLDIDDGVRNDAVRALAVLAGAKPKLAEKISPRPFISLLRSGEWSDHNKASFMLLALTQSRDARVLESIRAEALDSLVEMARWRSPGHATAALWILGRIAGLDEKPMIEMIEAGKAEEIIARLQTHPGLLR